jgi:hypothetical protein
VEKRFSWRQARLGVCSGFRGISPVEKTSMSQKRAEELFREWHDKEPRKFLRRNEPLLDSERFCCIGRGVNVLYESDKWERDGESFPYIHDFESRPGVWVAEKHCLPSERIGKPVKTSTLLGLRGSKDALHVAQLAIAKELVVENKDGEKFELELGKKGSPMYSTLDKKALLISTTKGPIIVRGGKMIVTSRGIVK